MGNLVKTMSDQDKLIKILEAISSPAGFTILESLRSGGLGYKDLMKRCDIDVMKDARKFSFYMLKIMRNGLMEFNISDKKYRLTCKGECISRHIKEMKRACLRGSDE